MVLNKEEFEEIVGGARGLARKTKEFITPSTLIIYVDKKGRLVRVPFELALREEGVKMPSKRHFINPRLRILDWPGKETMESKEEINGEVREWIKKSGARGFDKVLIVDEYAISGSTLRTLKEAFKEVTRKKVRTASLSRYEPSFSDFAAEGRSGKLLFNLGVHIGTPVKAGEKRGVFIQESGRAKNLNYPRYVKKMKSAFEKSGRARR